MDEWLELDDLIDRCEEMVEIGLYDEALSLLKRYSHIYTQSWEICVLYGRIYTDRNNPKAAVVWLKRGLQIDRNNAESLLGLFYAYAMMRKVKQGGKYLLRAEKHHPENEDILIALVWYYSEINENGTAIKYFERLEVKGTNNPEAYRNGAIAYQRSGLYEKAERCLKISLELNPQYDEALDMLADLYLFMGQEEKAIQLYQHALDNSPRNIRIISRLVYCYNQANRIEDAMSLAGESIRLFPNSPIGYIDLAYVYLNENQPQSALKYAEQALDVSPLEAEAYRVKGIAHSDLGEWEKGRAAFEKALEIDSENTEIMRDFYRHLRSCGDTEAMEKMIKTVIRLEQPYCIEDYWFLADYYREEGRFLDAFHYLKKAYKTVPAEKEIIPFMVDIILERGHTAYSIPFLFKYVGQCGWNNTMNYFARHKRFRKKETEEVLRFLRFFGQRPREYRQYIFRYYIERFLFLFVNIFVAGLLILIYMGSNSNILTTALAAGIYISFLGAFCLGRFLIHRRQELFLEPPL